MEVRKQAEIIINFAGIYQAGLGPDKYILSRLGDESTVCSTESGFVPTNEAPRWIDYRNKPRLLIVTNNYRIQMTTSLSRPLTFIVFQFPPALLLQFAKWSFAFTCFVLLCAT